MKKKQKSMDSDEIRGVVRKAYSKIAKEKSSCCDSSKKSSCSCGSSPKNFAQNLGYAKTDLAALPDGANMGLSCGNPSAMASLKPGETVLDLGSGGGFDVFICGRKVGRRGKAIGVDMTPDMLLLSRKNIEKYRKATGLDNVEFRLGEIEHLPLADSSVDAVISNCVINLSPDKPQVWKEIARVLKPEGRVAVSDIALFKPLPKALRSAAEELVSCVAGAVLVKDTARMARDAGLTEITLTPKSEFINALVEGKSRWMKLMRKYLSKNASLGDYITSLNITAKKPFGKRKR